ncbi:DUF3014 domain-containing protein [Xylophilus sp.]|uniref:DUF3014 domain-containing protein n=1 Tax=Xylophilus sp. TaxID=2653893 RepID=UPI0013B7B3AD|nr:DUF3014 domain-containing protein [Xylophilus sp.]KAF1047798.1 MAG: hypothetical protein GAK38_01741 [Xylophilus sp.]
MTEPNLRPPRQRSFPWLALAIVAALAAAGWYGCRQWQARQAAPPVAAAAPQAPVAEPAAEPAGPAHPIEPDPAAPALPALQESDAAVAAAIDGLAPRAQWQRFLVPDGLVRRVVATVDNLPRSHAPARIWPVQRTPPKLAVEGEGDALRLAPANAQRYTPFVQFVQSIDPARAAAVYRQLYPLFQQAYEELGYPHRHFNDRAVRAIDDLLGTPEPARPLALKLVEVRGSASEQPWLRYEYADPELERLHAGQKILLRVGPDHAKALKAWLARLRAGIAG